MITIPDGWKDEWENNVRRLYLCGRKHDMSIPDDQLDFMRDALFTMKNAENIIAQRDELLAALKEVSCDLECEIKARYGNDIHPAMQRKYDNDIDAVNRAKLLISKHESN